MAASVEQPDAGRQAVVLVNTSFDHDAPVSAAMRRVLTASYRG